MPAASTQEPHCGRSKWIDGKTVPAWARLALPMGEAGTTFGRGWFLFSQPRPRHMPYSMLRWHFSGRGWLHLNQPRPIQVPPGTQREQKRPEMCTASTREDVGPCPSWKLVLVKRLIISCLRDCLGLPVILNNPINH